MCCGFGCFGLLQRGLVALEKWRKWKLVLMLIETDGKSHNRTRASVPRDACDTHQRLPPFFSTSSSTSSLLLLSAASYTNLTIRTPTGGHPLPTMERLQVEMTRTTFQGLARLIVAGLSANPHRLCHFKQRRGANILDTGTERGRFRRLASCLMSLPITNICAAQSKDDVQRQRPISSSLVCSSTHCRAE